MILISLFCAKGSMANTETNPVVPIVPAPVPVNPPATAPVTVVKGEKPEKFIGQNFKRWQHKMMFYLTTLNLARFLTDERPKLE